MRWQNSTADGLPVDDLERVLGVDLPLDVGDEEARGVVPADAEGHLGQVVRAEAEELGHRRDLVGGDGAAGDLDHRPDEIVELDPLLLYDPPRRGPDDPLLVAGPPDGDAGGGHTLGP